MKKEELKDVQKDLDKAFNQAEKELRELLKEAAVISNSIQ